MKRVVALIFGVSLYANQNLLVLQNDIAQMRENLEGVTSLLGGINSQINLLSKRVTALEESQKFNFKSQEINEKNFNAELKSLKQATQNLSKSNLILTKNLNTSTANLAKLNEALQTLSRQTNAALKEQASHSNAIATQANALSSAVSQLNKSLDTLHTKQVIASDAKAQKLIAATVLTPQEILESADNAYVLKNFIQAREFYAKIVSFSPAYVNFKLGEIAFVNEDFVGAISHYQKSLQAAPKSEFTPTLLYHTAYSFLKLNKPQEAKRFFETLKARFPNSPESKNAPNLN